jgi:membrane protein
MPLSLVPPVAERASRAVQTFMGRGPKRLHLYALFQRMGRHNVGLAASAMAFDLFLAFIPMLALAGWLVTALLKNSPNAVGSVSLFFDLTPLEVQEVLKRHFGRFGAGAVAPIALLGALWLASSAFHTSMSVFEEALSARRRAWWTKRALAIVCVIAAISGVALSGYLAVWVAGGPLALIEFVAPDYSSTGAGIARWLSLVVIVLSCTCFLAAFYRIAVSRPSYRRRVWPGAVVTVLLGGAASAAFGYYARHLARFTLFYGSLAAVAIMLAWLWIWCALLLFGAEVNAGLEAGIEDDDSTPESSSAAKADAA